MKKKLIALWLVCVMTISLMGCGSNTTNVENLSTATEMDTQCPSTAVGLNWEIKQTENTKEKINMTGFFDENYGISGGYNGKIVYTKDGGKTWNDGANKSFCRFGIEILNKKVAYTCGNGGHITKTTDGGKNWSKKKSFGDMEPNQCRILSFVDEKLGMVASAESLAITEDGATSWAELNAPTDIIGLKLTANNVCYILGKDNIIFISKDKGQTWDKVEMHLPENTIYKTDLNSATFNMDENGKGELYCLNKDGGIMSLSTTDNCKTWTSNPMPETKGYEYIYLSKDAKTLTLNTLRGDAISVLIRK